MQRHAVEYLSGWFCFVQTSEGQVVSVFHSATEESDAVNFKKGIAAAFQANLKGTPQETEIDPNSKHVSHYRYYSFTTFIVYNYCTVKIYTIIIM